MTPTTLRSHGVAVVDEHTRFLDFECA